MRTGWKLHSIDELAQVSRGRSRHRPRNDPSLYGGEYPFIQTGDIHASDLYITSYSQTYSEAGLQQSRLWEPGVLCITNAGENTGDCAILGIRACFPDSILAIQPISNAADPVFLKYAIDLLKPQLRRVTRGATQDNLSAAKLLAFKFPAPPFSVQTRIGETLRKYGDMIENNRRRMALLEESARQLYQEWFVRLRFPGHEHTRITNGVPKGWERKKLGDICVDLREVVSPDELDPATPYIGLEHIPRRSISLSEWGRADSVTSSKLRFRVGDVLFGKIRPYFHKVGIAFTDGVTSADAIVLRATSDKVRSLVLMTAASDRFVAEVAQTVREGSKMPRADVSVMRNYPVPVPPAGQLESFSEAINTITDQLRILTFQNQKLRAARDLLLPRLMSGEVAV